MEKVFEFLGVQTDRSELRLSFDGIDLEFYVEDLNKVGGWIQVKFDTVLKFEFEGVGAHLRTSNEAMEVLVEESADDFLAARLDLGDTLINNRIRFFKVFFEDIGEFRIFARSVQIKNAEEYSPPTFFNTTRVR